MKEQWKHSLIDLNTLVLSVSLLSYLGFYLLDSIWPGFVSGQFDGAIFGRVAIVTGLINLLWPSRHEAKSKVRFPILIGVALLATLLVAYKVRSADQMDLLIPIGLGAWLMCWSVLSGTSADRD